MVRNVKKKRAGALKDLSGARKRAMPDFVSPQLATLVDEPPEGEEWLHELKFDGYRMLCHLSCGEVRFWSRNQKDWTEKFPNVVKAVQTFPATTAILDGEIVIVDKAGRSSFQDLQQSMRKSGTAAFIFQIFDLIYLDGYDISAAPLLQRKARVAGVAVVDQREDSAALQRACRRKRR